jgi:hypothetical protein
MTEQRCVDCVAEGVATVRPLVTHGPRSGRCMTHHRAELKRVKANAHRRHVERQFGMSAQQYNLLLQFQGGACFICQKAKGISKRLAVEHEHHRPGCEHPPETGCPRCWRALTCARCNKLVAFLDVDALARAIVLLTDPPARQLFGPT